MCKLQTVISRAMSNEIRPRRDRWKYGGETNRMGYKVLDDSKQKKS
jgi:hypothetical protein